MTRFAPRFLAALAVAGGLLSAPAFADPIETEPTAIVRHGDLDLTTPEGARKLNARVATAAINVCPQGDPMRLETMTPVILCRRAAIASARASVQTALAKAQGGERLAASGAVAEPATLR